MGRFGLGGAWLLVGTVGLVGGCRTQILGGDTDTARGPADDSDGFTVDTSVAATMSLELLYPPYVMEVGEDVVLEGRIRGVDGPGFSASSDVDGPLSATLSADRAFAVPLDGLSAGNHVLTLTATHPEHADVVEELYLGVCAWPEVETFDDASLAGWSLYGDAVWDAGGWLEITTNAQSKSGHIYLTNRVVKPGDFEVSFDFATGGGGYTGADGYSVNIVAVPTVQDLETYIGATSNGGCLGYGSSGPCGSHPVTALHVELDTWHNGEFSDPTSANHIAIARDGDPSDLLVWAALPFEDLTWRRVTVTGRGTRLSIAVDGSVIASKDIPDFQFEGGYLGVSGSTGYAYNHHRFDNLEIRDRCEVP